MKLAQMTTGMQEGPIVLVLTNQLRKHEKVKARATLLFIEFAYKYKRFRLDTYIAFIDTLKK